MEIKKVGRCLGRQIRPTADASTTGGKMQSVFIKIQAHRSFPCSAVRMVGPMPFVWGYPAQAFSTDVNPSLNSADLPPGKAATGRACLYNRLRISPPVPQSVTVVRRSTNPFGTHECRPKKHISAI